MESLWKNHYSRNTSLIHVGGKTRHASDILTSIGLQGYCTTREMAKNVLKRSKENPYRPEVRDREAGSLERIYRKLIIGQKEKSSKKRIRQRAITGLVEHGYLQVIDKIRNKKGHKVERFFLTFRGCFFVLGNEVNDEELISFLKNASKNFLFFRYLDRILEFTSIGFVSEIFLKPIKDLIEKDKITLDDDFDSSFVLIAEKIGQSVYSNYGRFGREYTSMMKKNWYDGRGNLNWQRNMVLLYYEDEEERDLFQMHVALEVESKLVFNVMRNVHYAFYAIRDEAIPIKHEQKLPKLNFNGLPFPKNKISVTGAELMDYRKKYKLKHK